MMRLLIAGLLPGLVFAQYCASSETLAPNGSIAAKLDGARCQLLDGSPYAGYRLTLPVRGRLQLEATATDGEVALSLLDAVGVKMARGASIERALEAGTYRVTVSARPAQAPAFTLRSTFVAEAGLFCGAFAALGVNQKAAGKLGAGGCLTPDGSPYDAYSIHAFGAGQLEIAAASEEFAPSLVLRDAAGHALAAGDGALVYDAPADSNYTLVVLGAGKTGAYQLASTFHPVDDDPCRPRASLTASDSKSGTINGQSCAFTVNIYGDQIAHDLYDVTLAESAAIEINASSTAFTPILYLFDASGVRIAAEAYSGGRTASVMRLWLPAGSYSLMIASAQTAGGAYTLQYTATPGPAKACATQPLSIGQVGSATLAATACRTGFGLSDLYQFTLPTAGSIEFAMQSEAFDTLLALRDDRDGLIVYDDDYQGYSDSYLLADLPAGTYSVAAVSNAGAGAYSLSSRFTAHEIAPCSRVEKLEVNTGAVRTLGFTPCRAQNGQPEDYYEFTLAAPGSVAIVVSSTIIDAFVTLSDASGAVLRTDDNSYGGYDALLVQYLEAGTYRIAVRAAQTSSIASYEIDLLYRAGDRPAGCAPRATLEPGAAVTGGISFTGCQLDTDFADVYQFTLAEKQAVEARVESADFDAYAILLDAKGNAVTEDDDSGGSGNARLSATLEPGVYHLIARPISQYAYDSGGAYTAVVNLLPPGDAPEPARARPLKTRRVTARPAGLRGVRSMLKEIVE